VWAALELVLGESQSLKGIEAHEVEATAPIHECFGEPGHPVQRVDDKGKPLCLGDAIRVVRSVKSDWGLGPAQALWDQHTHGVDHPASELELAA
jgi:hypothetical protein